MVTLASCGFQLGLVDKAWRNRSRRDSPFAR